MIRFIADENFVGQIIEALRQSVQADILTIHDLGVSSIDDESLLELAATLDRVVLTHDIQTLVGFAYARVKHGLPMPGVIAVNKPFVIRDLIFQLEYYAVAGDPLEFANRVAFMPSKS